MYENQDNNFRFGFDDNQDTKEEEPVIDPETSILESHKKIATAVETLRAEIMKAYQESGDTLDPRGMIAYAFDANTTTPEWVTHLPGHPGTVTPEMVAESPDPVFQIDFYPFTEETISRRSFFDEKGEDVNMSGGKVRNPQNFTFIDRSAHKVNGIFYPIGPEKPEWIEIESQPHGIYSVIDLKYPAVISRSALAENGSDIKSDEVIVVNVRPRDADRLVNLADGEMKILAEIAERISRGEFHYRIFGQLDRRAEGAQKPKFIIGKPRLSEGDNDQTPQLSASNGDK